MDVYVVIRQYRYVYDLDIKVAHDLNTAIKIANEFVAEALVDGYTLDLDCGDNGLTFFEKEEYKSYCDGAGDSDIAIWIEKQKVR